MPVQWLDCPVHAGVFSYDRDRQETPSATSTQRDTPFEDDKGLEQRKSVVNFKVTLDLNLHVQEVCNFIKAALHFKLERLSQRKNLNLFRRET